MKKIKQEKPDLKQKIPTQTFKIKQILKSFDFDEFETAIVKDWSTELSEGNACIKSLPVEFVGEVRQDLVRIAAWSSLNTSQILLVMVQGSDRSPSDRIRNYCRTYTELNHITVHSISDKKFTKSLCASLEKSDSKVIVIIECESFSRLNVTLQSPLVVPATDISWRNFTFLTEVMDPDGEWHLMLFPKNGESSMIRSQLIFITVALIYDRIGDEEIGKL